MKQEQLNEQPKKKYIEVQYSALTQGYLREYCTTHGFDISTKFDGKKIDPDEFDFHSTVVFSSSEHIIDNSEMDVHVMVYPKNFALFGEKQNILVLEIESPALLSLREYFVNEYDMQDEFPDYRPHISLSYNYEGELPDVELPNADLLEADRLKIKDQKVFK